MQGEIPTTALSLLELQVDFLLHWKRLNKGDRGSNELGVGIGPVVFSVLTC